MDKFSGRKKTWPPILNAYPIKMEYIGLLINLKIGGRNKDHA